jgi:hypothetical protein
MIIIRATTTATLFHRFILPLSSFAP